MRANDVLKYELIGLEIAVTQADNPSLIGLQGKVVAETRNTLTIQHKNTEKKLIKDQIVFTTTIHNKKVEIDGALLVGRPEERLKKKTR